MFLVILVLTVVSVNAEKRGSCIWKYKSADRSVESKPGVIPVELRCSKGFLEWSKPKGGLQVKFKTPVELLGLDFSVRLISTKDIAIFYEEVNNGLKILRGFEKHDPNSVINVASKNGEAGLYVVILDKEDQTKKADSNQLRIDYELQVKQGTNSIEDCRMCSAIKMAELFCKGDFAVKAKIQNKYLHKDGMNVYLDLHVYHLFRQSAKIFLNTVEGSYHIGQVMMHGKCSPPKGRQHYIFLGELESESLTPRVDCYMRYALWRLLKRQIKCRREKEKRRERVTRDIKEVYYSSRR